MSLHRNAILAARLALNIRRFDGVWRRDVLPLTEAIPAGHPLRRRLLRRMKQHTRLIAGFFGPAVFGLFGETVTPAARTNLGMIGASIPAFDMCFDDNLMEVSRLGLLVEQPAGFVPLNEVEQLAATIYTTLLRRVAQPDLLRSLTLRMLAIEEESRLQLRDDTPTESILHITRTKGGVGGLFFTTALPGLLSVERQEALYKLGSWVQLVDDLFDLRDDALNGIRTPVTDCLSVQQLRVLLGLWRDEAFQAVTSLNLPDRRKRTFLAGFRVYSATASRYVGQIEKVVGHGPLLTYRAVSAQEAIPSGTWKALFD